jgi:hypothetical protein
MIHLPPLQHDRPHLVTWGLTATAAGGLAIFTAMRRASSRVIRVIAQSVFAEEDLLPTKKGRAAGVPLDYGHTGTVRR